MNFRMRVLLDKLSGPRGEQTLYRLLLGRRADHS